MADNLAFRMPRKIRIFLIFLVLLLVAFFIIRFFFAKINGVPRDFLKARQEASLIAQDIVGISTDSAKKIEDISMLTSSGKDEEALNLIVSEIEKNRQMRERAMQLSAQLEKMTKNSSSISPVSSARVALEAVGTETTLISNLITYNEYLNKLLETLRTKLLEQNNVSQGNIQDLIVKINSEAKLINELNEKFNQLMNQFDKGENT